MLFRRDSRRAGALLSLLFLLLAAALPVLAEEPAKTREQLEQEIAERQAELEKLASREQVEEEPSAESTEPVESAADPTGPREDEDASAQRRRHRDEDVTFGQSRRIVAGHDSGPMVLIGGTLEIEKGAAVEGDATVVGGGARVAGKVFGTLVVIGGGVHLENGADIEGDLISVGAPIREHGDDIRIEGQKVQIAFGDFSGFAPIFGGGDFRPDHWSDGFGSSLLELLGRLFRIGVLLLVVFLVLLVAPARSAAIASQVASQPWRAGLVGLLAEVLFLPLFLIVVVVLLISVIGIPLVLVVPPLMLVSLVVFLLLGYAGVALAAGRIIERRFGKRYSPFALALCGLALIEGWSLLGELLVGLPGPIQLSGFLALAAGFLIEYLAWTVGLGAVLGDLAERRRLARDRGQALAEGGLVDHLDAQ